MSSWFIKNSAFNSQIVQVTKSRCETINSDSCDPHASTFIYLFILTNVWPVVHFGCVHSVLYHWQQSHTPECLGQTELLGFCLLIKHQPSPVSTFIHWHFHIVAVLGDDSPSSIHCRLRVTTVQQMLAAVTLWCFNQFSDLWLTKIRTW